MWWCAQQKLFLRYDRKIDTQKKEKEKNRKRPKSAHFGTLIKYIIYCKPNNTLFFADSRAQEILLFVILQIYYIIIRESSMKTERKFFYHETSYHTAASCVIFPGDSNRRSEIENSRLRQWELWSVLCGEVFRVARSQRVFCILPKVRISRRPIGCEESYFEKE